MYIYIHYKALVLVDDDLYVVDDNVAARIYEASEFEDSCLKSYLFSLPETNPDACGLPKGARTGVVAEDMEGSQL